MNMHGNESTQQYQAEGILSLLLLFLFVKWNKIAQEGQAYLKKKEEQWTEDWEELNAAEMLIHNCIFKWKFVWDIHSIKKKVYVM